VANTHSAVKRHRKSLKRNARNTAARSEVKTAIKKVREASTAGDGAKASAAARAATRLLDKAASRGILHPKNAARRISRAARAANKAAAAKKTA
jgi:small subunit ribosomal protein S20